MADSKFAGAEERRIFDNFSLSASTLKIDEKRKDELGQMAILLEHRANESKEQQANAVEGLNEYAPWQGAHSNGSCL